MIIITAKTIEGINQTTTNFESKGRLARKQSSQSQSLNNDLMGSSYDDETQVKKGSEDKTIENSKPKSEPANQDKKREIPINQVKVS
jgi:hypothetical protein